MEFDGLVDITQRFATLVKSAITDKKDLFLVPTDYYKRETDAVAYIVGSDHSVYKVSIFEKMHIGSIAYRKVRLKDAVGETKFSEYIYRLSYALAHSFTPSAFSTIPKKKCNCGNDHCDCHNHDDKEKKDESESANAEQNIADRPDNFADLMVDPITEEDTESDSKFRPSFLSK
jgi:hypothetical protein